MYFTIIIFLIFLLIFIKVNNPQVNIFEMIFSFIIFILGFYFIFKNPIIERFEDTIEEQFDDNELNIESLNHKFHKRCPNTLIQKGNELYLFNTNIVKIPGVNPLKFNNLHEYTQFIEWQRSQGIKCPILFLQESYDAQGNRVFKARQSPTELNGGLPNLDMNGRYPDPDPGNTLEGKSLLLDAGVDDPPFNDNSFPGYDPDNQYIGLETPLDKLYNENNSVLPNLTNKSRNEEIFQL